MVGVEVRDEDRVEIAQADRPQQLALRTFAAVEQQALAAAPQEQRRQPAARGRCRAGGADEQDVEIHQSSITCLKATRPPSTVAMPMV